MKAAWIDCNDRLPLMGLRVLVWTPTTRDAFAAKWYGSCGWNLTESAERRRRDWASHWQPIEGPDVAKPDGEV